MNKSNSLNDSTNDAESTSKSDQIHSLTQLILSLDMEQWETLVQVFHIQNSMIQNEN